MSEKKINWDQHLERIHKEFITIKDEDYKKSQEIFDGVLEEMRKTMGEQCPFFKNMSKHLLYAGSVYDGIKVSKLDEYDMDIVIRLPINYNNDIVIENDQPGYIKLKIPHAFGVLDTVSNWEKRNKVTRCWTDSGKYLLQNKFRSWMQSVVQKALNELNGEVTVQGVRYKVKYKESGPATTLNIENVTGSEEFKLDVDLVPVIRFQLPRWPEGYRQVRVENNSVEDWLAVPKPNKAISDKQLKNRCWRLSFQEFERDMMNCCNQLKPTIRLMKKLRDSLKIDIASYYIKTLFLWKIDENDDTFWNQGLGILFPTMVNEFYKAIVDKEIKYFWNEDNNLISHMKAEDLELYANELKKVLDGFDEKNVIRVVSCLLSTDELERYQETDFYKNQLWPFTMSPTVPICYLEQEPVASTSSLHNKQKENLALNDLVKTTTDKTNIHFNEDSKPKTEISGKNNISNGRVIDCIQHLQEKIVESLQQLSIIDALMYTHCYDKNQLETEWDGKTALKEIVFDLICSLQESVHNLAKVNDDEKKVMIVRIVRKINVIVDKTDELINSLNELKISDVQYNQKLLDLNNIVFILLNENEELLMDIVHCGNI